MIAAMGRIYRLQQKDPSLVGLIDKLTKEDKAKFYADSKELLGDNLVAKIRATSQEMTESSNVGSNHFKGVWLDEEDLNAKYEEKPFQLACVKERARAMGLYDHYAELEARGLGEAAVFTAQGNALGHVAVARRIGQAVRSWLRGGLTERHRYPTPAAVEDLYQRLRGLSESGADGGTPLPCAPAAFPADLCSFLVYCRVGGTAAAAAQHAAAGTSPAAGSGCPAQ